MKDFMEIMISIASMWPGLKIEFDYPISRVFYLHRAMIKDQKSRTMNTKGA